MKGLCYDHLIAYFPKIEKNFNCSKCPSCLITHFEWPVLKYLFLVYILRYFLVSFNQNISFLGLFEFLTILKMKFLKKMYYTDQCLKNTSLHLSLQLTFLKAILTFQLPISKFPCIL